MMVGKAQKQGYRGIPRERERPPGPPTFTTHNAICLRYRHAAHRPHFDAVRTFSLGFINNCPEGPTEDRHQLLFFFFFFWSWKLELALKIRYCSLFFFLFWSYFEWICSK
ncbi:hypothetical protein CIPAW_09G080600 [Carya illinoinensis]|uniref:Uncharacterized protein n=1 Tax=Carya illinoinensis TaxID=32201 RepID=A0A8T1PMD5_CARIL|nr:hypothetical protein CIPAW_09G080600 [Carya illinoinensis]